jgi:H3 lysine-79-specific histone-lysine N-methyltransferase
MNDWSSEEEEDIATGSYDPPQSTTRKSWTTNYSKSGTTVNEHEPGNHQPIEKLIIRRNLRSSDGSHIVTTSHSQAVTHSTVEAKCPKTKMKKLKKKKSVEILGLDLLHQETILSTAVDKSLPPAPGCIDHRLAPEQASTSTHPIKLEEPTSLPPSRPPSEVPIALQNLLDVYRNQFLAVVENMKSQNYRNEVKQQILLEKERNKKLKCRASQLDKQIKVLIDDSVALMKRRLFELNIKATTPNDLLSEAKKIVKRHRELQITITKLQPQVLSLEEEHSRLLRLRQAEMLAAMRQPGSSLTSEFNKDTILHEISAALNQKKQLESLVNGLESEVTHLEQKLNIKPNFPRPS